MRHGSTHSLTSVLDGRVGGQSHGLDALLPRPGTHVQEARWVAGPVWTEAENFAPTGIPTPDHPDRCESLYRLSYPGHSLIYGSLFNDCVFTKDYTASDVRKQTRKESVVMPTFTWGD